ncbi:hypothetical protein AAZF84_02025, partial [Bacillus sp. JR_15]
KRRSIDNAADGAGFRGKTFESASDNLSFNRIECFINHPPPFIINFFPHLLYKNIFFVSTILLILVSTDLEIFYAEEKGLFGLKWK